MKAERVLWAAAAYNVAFGIFVGVFPNAYFEWLAMDLPRYPSLWQCIGMIVACYGVGYAFASACSARSSCRSASCSGWPPARCRCASAGSC